MQSQPSGGPWTSCIYLLFMVIVSCSGRIVKLLPLDPALVAEAREVGLKCHNDYRTLHGSPPLILDDVLNEQADLWSVEMAMKQRVFVNKVGRMNIIATNQTRHKKSEQNVESTYLTDLKASICLAADAFYKGICSYEGPHSNKKLTREFTQLVWAESRQVGFGFAIAYKEGDDPAKKGELYITEEYYPAGNINEDDYYIQNVKHPLNPEEVWNQQDCMTSSQFDGNLANRGEDWFFRLVQSPDMAALKAARQAALKRHNELRAMHGVPELAMDEVLNERAQKWAEQREQSATFGYDKKSYKQMGQNVYKGANTTSVTYGVEEAVAAAVMATNSWYHEICNYEEGITTNISGIGKSFIQLVWESVDSVGFGIAMGYDKRRTGEISVVANYRPLKNLDDAVYYINNSMANVKRPLNPNMVWDEQKCPPESKGRVFLQQGNRGTAYPIVVMGSNGTATPSNMTMGANGTATSSNMTMGANGTATSSNMTMGANGTATSSNMTMGANGTTSSSPNGTMNGSPGNSTGNSGNQTLKGKKAHHPKLTTLRPPPITTTPIPDYSDSTPWDTTPKP